MIKVDYLENSNIIFIYGDSDMSINVNIPVCPFVIQFVPMIKDNKTIVSIEINPIPVNGWFTLINKYEIFGKDINKSMKKLYKTISNKINNYKEPNHLDLNECLNITLQKLNLEQNESLLNQ